MKSGVVGAVGSLGLISFGVAWAMASAPAPTVTMIDPAQGPVAGGTAVKIRGTQFADGATVKIGNYPCTDPRVISATELSCVVPENIARKADVVVTNADGTTGKLSQGFTYKGTPTFKLLQSRAFQRFAVNSAGVLAVYKCSGCHGGSKPDGNLDTKDYNQLIRHVMPRDPSKSTLYKVLLDRKMPPSERQPPMAAEEIQAVADWITDGAQNN